MVTVSINDHGMLLVPSQKVLLSTHPNNYSFNGTSALIIKQELNLRPTEL